MLKDLCFEIIQTCPNNCQFCSSVSSMDKKCSISYGMFTKTIDHLYSQGGIEEVSISGGEPFLHPNLFDMIDYCHQKGIRTVLFTSGIKIREKLYLHGIKLSDSERKIVESIDADNFSSISKEDIKRLKSCGLDKIVFDFQGAEPETYDLLMGTKNRWTYVAKSMLIASLNGLETDVHFIPMKKNYRELPDLVDLLNIAEIDQLSILNFVSQGRGEVNSKDLMLDEYEMREFALLVNDAESTFKGRIRVGIPLIKKDRHLCTAGLSKMVIKYDGTVLPCPAFKEYDIKNLKRLGIKVENIYSSLEKVIVHPGSRVEPLCKKIYDFDKSIK